jgi:hypothetical protein
VAKESLIYVEMGYKVTVNSEHLMERLKTQKKNIPGGDLEDVILLAMNIAFPSDDDGDEEEEDEQSSSEADQQGNVKKKKKNVSRVQLLFFADLKGNDTTLEYLTGMKKAPREFLFEKLEEKVFFFLLFFSCLCFSLCNGLIAARLCLLTFLIIVGHCAPRKTS